MVSVTVILTCTASPVSVECVRLDSPCSLIPTSTLFCEVSLSGESQPPPPVSLLGLSLGCLTKRLSLLSDIVAKQVWEDSEIEVTGPRLRTQTAGLWVSKVSCSRKLKWWTVLALGG